MSSPDTDTPAAPAAAPEAKKEPLYLYKCKCGKCQIKFAGEPVLNLNCHCHSCLAASKHISEKYPDGTSAVVEGGGVGAALFRLVDVVEADDLTDDQFGYVKVGDTGGNIRVYTKCCGSAVTISGGAAFPCNWIPIIRNGVVKASDGTTPYVPATPVPETQVKCAADPASVPEPKFNVVPPKLAFAFVSGMLKKKLGVGGNPALKDKKLFYATGAEEDVEVVAKTWE